MHRPDIALHGLFPSFRLINAEQLRLSKAIDRSTEITFFWDAWPPDIPVPWLRESPGWFFWQR